MIFFCRVFKNKEFYQNEFEQKCDPWPFNRARCLYDTVRIQRKISQVGGSITWYTRYTCIHELFVKTG